MQPPGIDSDLRDFRNPDFIEKSPFWTLNFDRLYLCNGLTNPDALGCIRKVITWTLSPWNKNPWSRGKRFRKPGNSRTLFFAFMKCLNLVAEFRNLSNCVHIVSKRRYYQFHDVWYVAWLVLLNWPLCPTGGCSEPTSEWTIRSEMALNIPNWLNSHSGVVWHWYHWNLRNSQEKKSSKMYLKITNRKFQISGTVFL